MKLKGFRGVGTVALAVLAALFLSSISGCGGGGGDQGVSSEVVSGVASVGQPLAGQVSLKDSSTPAREKATTIASDGSFAVDVTDLKGPFILRAQGTAGGVSYTLFSFAGKPGIANINPLSSALTANAAGVDDPAQVYDNCDAATLQKIHSNLPRSLAELQTVLRALFRNFGVENGDPVAGNMKADHTGFDDMFDRVKITVSNGILTITNVQTGAVIYSGPVREFKGEYFKDDQGGLPKPGSVPSAPTGVTATGGANEVTISWKSVKNAASYNIYWSTTSGVTPANGTKIAGVTSPYLHSGLTAGATYYYIITAVNSAGESPASAEVTAATGTAAPPPPAVPDAPTGVMAVGGTKQVTVSWPAVSGADSYNVYWSTTSGVTAATGTKITGATSPAVQTGLNDGTTYYYVVTAVNDAGESAPSVQVAATTLTLVPPPPAPEIPAAPTGVAATGGVQQVTVSWPAVSGATSYNIYWATTSGVSTSTGTRISGVTSPYVHTGLSEGATYYYVVTAVNSAGESAASAEVSATTNAPAVSIASLTINPASVQGGTASQGTVTLAAAAPAGGATVALSSDSASAAVAASVTIAAGSSSAVFQIATTAVTANTAATITATYGASSASAVLTMTPQAIDGAALYTANCAGCHGGLSSSRKRGATAAQIQAAIDKDSGGMGQLSWLTPAQIQAIAAALNF